MWDFVLFLFLNLLFLVFSEILGSIVWCLSLILENSWLLCLQIFFSAHSLSSSFGIPIIHKLDCLICPIALGYSLTLLLLFFFNSVFFLSFSVWVISFDWSLISWILSLTLSNMLMTLSKAFILHALTVVFTFSISIQFFFTVSITLLHFLVLIFIFFLPR